MVRFAGIIDKDRRNCCWRIPRRCECPLIDDKSQLRKFFRFATIESIGKEYDETLGAMNYLAARRNKLVFVSFPFPLSDIILLISAEPRLAEIEKLASFIFNVSCMSSDSNILPDVNRIFQYCFQCMKHFDILHDFMYILLILNPHFSTYASSCLYHYQICAN